MNEFKPEKDQIIHHYMTSDLNTRKLIKKALCDAVINQNYLRSTINELVAILSPKEVSTLCKNLLQGSQSDDEYAPLLRGGRVLPVMDIVLCYKENLAQNTLQSGSLRCFDEIMTSVDNYLAQMQKDDQMGKTVCYRNAHFLSKLYADAAQIKQDENAYSLGKQISQQIAEKHPNLNTSEEEVAFQNIYEIRSEDIGSYNSEKFWTKYEKITGRNENV